TDEAVKNNMASEYTQLNSNLSSILASHKTQNTLDRTISLFGDWDLLCEMAKKKKNMSSKQAQGWQMEILETAKFNRNATRKNSSLFAQTTDSLGGKFTQHPADIWIKDGNGTIVREAQVKSMGNAAETVNALRDKKYTGMQRIGAKDFNERTAELVDKRLQAEGNINQQAYADLKENLSMDGLSHNDIKSGGTTRKEALDATDIKKASARVSQEKIKDLSFDLHNTGVEAAKTGAIIGGGLTILNSVSRYASGHEIDKVDVVMNIAADTTTAALASYASAASTRLIEHGVRKAFVESTARSIIKSSAPSAMASATLCASKSFYRYLNNDIDSEQFLSEVSNVAIVGASSFYYAAFGQMVIPIPVVGALIGSTVGYFLGNMLHQTGLISLGEAPNVTAARERREQIEKICLDAIPLMQANRLQMEELVEKHFQRRASDLNLVFDRLESSLFDISDAYYNALNDLNKIYGQSISFTNQKEFNDFMLDDSQDFVL
ncbi:MAG: hypothetical protein ABS921_08490, partial [Psychrobacter alimentarius]